jgi:hypothetical protein
MCSYVLASVLTAGPGCCREGTEQRRQPVGEGRPWMDAGRTGSLRKASIDKDLAWVPECLVSSALGPCFA